MATLGGLLPGDFCWLDLAATNEDHARQFYADAFDWTFAEQRANGGRYTHCLAGGRAIGSLYRLRRSDVERGVPSHWTPYVCVESVDASARSPSRRRSRHSPPGGERAGVRGGSTR